MSITTTIGLFFHSACLKQSLIARAVAAWGSTLHKNYLEARKKNSQIGLSRRAIANHHPALQRLADTSDRNRGYKTLHEAEGG